MRQQGTLDGDGMPVCQTPYGEFRGTLILTAYLLDWSVFLSPGRTPHAHIRGGILPLWRSDAVLGLDRGHEAFLTTSAPWSLLQGIPWFAAVVSSSMCRSGHCELYMPPACSCFATVNPSPALSMSPSCVGVMILSGQRGGAGAALLLCHGCPEEATVHCVKVAGKKCKRPATELLPLHETEM